MFLLGIVGDFFPKLAEPISTIMQEHIAGRSILTFVGPIMFLGFLCSIRNPYKERNYGTKIKLFIINPSNFLISLCFVAAAINWAVTLSAKISFPYIAKGAVFEHMLTSSIEITAITLFTTLALWLYHIKWNEFEADSGKREAASWLFSVLLFISSIFWISFWGRIVYLVSNA